MAKEQVRETEDDNEIEEGQEKPEKAEKLVVKEDDEGNVTVSEPRRATRKERRAERQDDVVSRYRDEAASLRNELAQRDAIIAQRLSQVENRVQQPEDPHKRKQAAIRNEQENIQALVKQAQTPAELERLKARFYELNDEAEELRDSRIIERVRGEAQRASQPAAGAAEEAILRSEFNDVVNHVDPRTGDRSAIRWAKGLYDQMLAEGQPPTLTTQRAALAKAAEKFGLRQAAAPVLTTAQQQRYGAIPGQAGVGGGGELRLESHQKKLALARWPELDEKDAYRKMAALLRAGAREEQVD